jgi:hypothetical protein
MTKMCMVSSSDNNAGDDGELEGEPDTMVRIEGMALAQTRRLLRT